MYSPLDLPTLLREPLLLSRTRDTLSSSKPFLFFKNIYWKLTFVHPDKNSLNEDDAGIVEWLYHKLRHHQPRSDHTFSHQVGTELLTRTVSPIFPTSEESSGSQGDRGEDTAIAGQHRQLCLVVKGLCDQELTRDEQELSSELCGSSALMVFLPTPQSSDQSAEVRVSRNCRTVCNSLCDKNNGGNSVA